MRVLFTFNYIMIIFTYQRQVQSSNTAQVFIYSQDIPQIDSSFISIQVLDYSFSISPCTKS